MIFVFPVPHLPHKALPAQVLAGDALLFQLALHHILGGDAGMVRARHPQGGAAGHAVVADQQILHAAGDGVAQMQRAGDIGRRHGDHKGGGVRVHLAQFALGLRAEEAFLFPPFVQDLFALFGVVCLGHLGVGHGFVSVK